MDYKEKVIALLKSKELSKEQKEKLEAIFPELKKSEDEKIRKSLITFFQRFPYDSIENAGTTAKEALAWLEKQGERKPVSITDEWIEDYWKHHKVINPYSYDKGEEIQFDHRGFLKFCKNYCKKPVEWSEGDERILREIKRYIKEQGDKPTGLSNGTVAVSDMIAWLEKQGPIDKDKLAKGFLRSVATTIMQYLDANTAEGKMCLSNMECEDIENAVFNADWAKVYRYMKKKLEKLDEQKPYGQRKECKDCQFNYAGECKGFCQMKRDEQKPVDKVEPKFKVGDWLQYRYAEPFLVEEITEQGYCNGDSCLPFELEDEIHLWTIQDAKDGDVLVASDGSIFLFAGVDDCACKYYVALTTDNHVEINKETKGGYWETSRAVYPATKEQRDKLEKAMLNAGYKWNKEELKLEKI